LTALAAIIASGTTTSAVASERWDLPTAYSNSNFHTKNIEAFARAVAVATDGKLRIVVHSAGSLFKGNEIKRAVQTGQVPIGERLLSAHQNENAVFGVDSVPFLATSFEASERLWKVSRPTLERILEKQNLVLLYAVPWPPQGLYFKKEINSRADMKGLKFRAYDVTTARLAELAGMRPVRIEEAELVQALAAGMAESFMSSGATGYDRKIWEYLDYFYAVDAWLPRNYVFANKDAWDKLDEATRKAVRSVAIQAERAGTSRSQELAKWYIEQLAANGMSVQHASSQLQKDLREIAEIMTVEWLVRAGPDGKAVIEKYEAMQ